MEVKVNIIDTLFTTIPKNTVVASYTIDEDSVDLTMLNDQYSFNTTNKTILTSSNVTSNNLKAINFTARNWVSGEQVEINDMYPRVVSKLQNKFNKPNTIYKVTKDLDLNHCVLTIPEGCTLQFDGGTISNGSLSGNFTKIIADSSTVIFGQQIHIEGSWNIADIYDEWFWFDTDPSYISNDTIKNILALSNDSINNTIHFDANRTYYFELPYKGRANLGDDIRPDYWKLNTPDYDFLRIFTGVTSNTHLVVNNTLQMLPTNQGAYFIFQIENKENIEISGTGTINGDAKDHLYTDPFAGTLYYGEWGHVLNFRSCNNIVIRDITVGYAFGDGIALGNAAYNTNGVKSCNPATKNVLIDGVKVLYARRNGISLGGNNYSITNVYFEGCGSDEIKGTAPMAAIDFENDYIDIDPSGICSNVVMSSCKFKDNKYDASSTIRDDLATIPAGELIVISDCNFTAPLRLNRTHGLTFNNCHIVGISSHDNSISAWYASSDLIFNCCVFDELNPYLAISAEEQGKKFVNPTYPEDIKYSTTFQHSLSSTKALKFTIPKPLVGLVEFTAFCSNPNYSAVQMPINTTEYTFGNSQRLTGIRDVKVRTTQDSTPRYAMYKNTPVFSYINYAEDADNFIIYFAIGGQILGDPLAGNTSVNIFVTSKTKFIVVEAPVSTNPGVAGMYGGKWSGLSAITKQSIDLSSIPSTVTFPNKEMFPSNLLADLPTSLTPDRVGFSQFVLDVSYKRPVFWDSYSNVFRTADGNRALERRVTSLVELDALAAKLTADDRGYVVYYTVTNSYLTWRDGDWINEDGSLFNKVKYIKTSNTIDILNIMFSYSNVIYKVCADIDLGGGTLTIASNSTLDFQGGSFSNGNIVFQNTKIIADKDTQIFNNISFSNLYEISIKWFGAKGDGVTDDTNVFLAICNKEYTRENQLTVHIPVGVYVISQPINPNAFSDENYTFQNWIGEGTKISPDRIYDKIKSSKTRTVLYYTGNSDLAFINAVSSISNITIRGKDNGNAAGQYTLYPEYDNTIGINISVEDQNSYASQRVLDDVQILFFGTGIKQGPSFSITMNNVSMQRNGFGYIIDTTPNLLGMYITYMKINNIFISTSKYTGLKISSTLSNKIIFDGFIIQKSNGTNLEGYYDLDVSSGGASSIEFLSGYMENAGSIRDKVTANINSVISMKDTVLHRGTYKFKGGVIENSQSTDAIFDLQNTSITLNNIRAYDIQNYGNYDSNGYVLVTAKGGNINNNKIINSGTTGINFYKTLFEGIEITPLIYNPLTHQFWFRAGDDEITFPGNLFGNSNNRPTSNRIGTMYFDTTLNKYICWNGIKWINLDGTALT